MSLKFIHDNTMRSNSKEVKEKIQAYIKESIDLSGYEKENTITNLWEVFLQESYNDGRHEQYRFMDWLRGLPSAISVEMYYKEMREIMTDWGISTEGKNDSFVFDWYLFLIYREVKAMLKIEEVAA